MMKRVALILSVVAATALLVVLVSSSQDAPASLLQSIPVMGTVEQEQPLQLYATPQQQAAILAQQHPLLAGAPRVQSPLRYVYVPGTALVQTPYGPRYVKYYQPEVIPEQPVAPKLAQTVPSESLLQKKRAQEIQALKKALASAEMHEANYEKKVTNLKAASIKEAGEAQKAKADLANAAHLQTWSKMEKAAAARLANVEKEAQLRVQKQEAKVNKLLPIVRQEVSKRRVLEQRLAKASYNAQQSSQQEMFERQKLMQDMQIAQAAEQHAQAAQLSYKTLQKRAIAMSNEAKADRLQAKKDIAEARASVLGARKNAASTLAAIRASMGKKGSTVTSEVEEQKFATAARQATKEMSSKKRDAKALRERARRLDSQSRQLTLSAAQWQEEIPSALAKAHQTQAEAQHLRAVLKNTVQSSLPFNDKVANAQELTQLSHIDTKQFIQKLAKTEQAHQQASALLARVHHVAATEELAAERDAVLARRRMALAQKRLVAAEKNRVTYEQKMKTLQAVLSDSKQELAELQTEAQDVVGPE